MVMTNTKTAAAEGRGLDPMGRRTRLESPRSPADSHGPGHVRRPATTPAYYLGRPAEMWLAAFRRDRSGAKVSRNILDLPIGAQPGSRRIHSRCGTSRG